MKKIFCFILCVLIVILMTACNMETNEGSTTENTDEPTQPNVQTGESKTDIGGVTSDITTTETAQDDTTHTENTNTDIQGDSPYCIDFPTVEHILCFLHAINGTEAEYGEFKKIYPYNLDDYWREKNAAPLIESCMLFPVVKDGAEVTGFTYSYNTYAKFFEACFKVGDVLYRVQYVYSVEYPGELTTPLAIPNCQVGDCKVNMHYSEDGRWIIGRTVFDSTYISLIAQTNEPDQVNWDWCEIKDFSELYEDIENNRITIQELMPLIEIKEETYTETVVTTKKPITTGIKDEEQEPAETDETTIDNPTSSRDPWDTDISWDSEYIDEPCTEVSVP